MNEAQKRLALELFECSGQERNITKLIGLDRRRARDTDVAIVDAYRDRVVEAMCSDYSEAEMKAAISFYKSADGASFLQSSEQFGHNVRDIIVDLLKDLR